MRKLYGGAHGLIKDQHVWCFSSVVTNPRTISTAATSSAQQPAIPENAESAPDPFRYAFVLAPGGCADGAQGATRQRGFSRLAASPVPDVPPAPTSVELHQQKGLPAAASARPLPASFQARFKFTLHGRPSQQRANSSDSNRTLRSEGGTSPPAIAARILPPLPFSRLPLRRSVAVVLATAQQNIRHSTDLVFATVTGSILPSRASAVMS